MSRFDNFLQQHREHREVRRLLKSDDFELM
jgi:hypothetical protein